MIAIGAETGRADGERIAVIYPISQNCKLNGAEPFAYFTDVMQKIAEGLPNSRIDKLMRWARSQSARQKATPQIMQSQPNHISAPGGIPPRVKANRRWY